MATALDIIKGAMRLVGALEAGATPSGEDSSDALDSLNDFMEQLSLDRLVVFQVLNETFTWAAGNATRTIGPSGNFVTVRPTRLEDGCFIRDSAGYDWPLRTLNSEGFQSIGLKTQANNLPEWIYYAPEMPDGKIYLWPVPSVDVTLSISSLKQLSSFPAPSTVVVLPPGYKRMLTYSLAVTMAPEWVGRDASATVQGIAAESKAAVMRINTTRPKMPMDRGLRRPSRRGGYNIQSDGYR
jgi:hypothetical protein